jgi:hypothetical protein
MTGKYATPLAFKSALEERLRERAKVTGKDMTRLRQLLVFERFIHRVTVEFGDQALVKGGVALELRLDRARTTKDVDFRLMGSPQGIHERLYRAGRLDLQDRLLYLVRPNEDHPSIDNEGVNYDGFRFVAEGQLAGKPYGLRFGVDVVFGEPVFGLVDILEPTNFLDFAGVPGTVVRVYPRETHVAEKLHAYTMLRSRENSRVKDLPDVAILGLTGAVDAVALKLAIDGTFQFRATHPVPSVLVAPPSSWEVPYAKIARANDLPWATLAEVHVAAGAFLDPVLAGQPGTWDVASWNWRR